MMVNTSNRLAAMSTRAGCHPHIALRMGLSLGSLRVEFPVMLNFLGVQVILSSA